MQCARAGTEFVFEKFMTCLSFSDTSVETLARIARVALSSPSVYSLRLNLTSLMQDSAPGLAQAREFAELLQSSSLRRLSLHRYPVSIELFSLSLEKNTSLTSVDLPNFILTLDDAAYLAHALIKNTTLTSLDLSGAHESAVCVILNALALNSSLTNLVISSREPPLMRTMENLMTHNFSLRSVRVNSSALFKRLLARNVALACIRFSPLVLASASRKVVLFGSESAAAYNLLAGARHFDDATNCLRSAEFRMSLRSSPPKDRPLRHDPSLLVDFVSLRGQQYYPAKPSVSFLPALNFAPVVARSVQETRLLCVPGSCLIFAVRCIDSDVTFLASTQPHIVCYFDEEPPASSVVRLSSLFPSAAAVVPSSELVATMRAMFPAAEDIPSASLLFQRELHRARLAVLSWASALALARRCGILDPDDVPDALAFSASSHYFVDHFVVPNVSQILDGLYRVFAAGFFPQDFPLERRRAALVRRRQFQMTRADAVCIFRSYFATDGDLGDDSVLVLLQTFHVLYPVDDQLFVVRSPSHPVANLAVYSQLLRHADRFQMVDARKDGRLYFQHDGRRYEAWADDSGAQVSVVGGFPDALVPELLIQPT